MGLPIKSKFPLLITLVVLQLGPSHGYWNINYVVVDIEDCDAVEKLMYH